MRADEPRVTVRFSDVDHAMLSVAAEKAGVSLGSLVREGAMLHAAALAGASAREVKLRGRSAAATRAPSSAALPAGVRTGREVMLERQRKLNERRP